VDWLENLNEALLLSGDGPEILVEGGMARVELHREDRKGVPEIIYAERKAPADSLAIARRFLSDPLGPGRAILSRVQPELRQMILAELAELEFEGRMVSVALEDYLPSRMLVLRRAGLERPKTGGRVGILTAGTSDIPIAEEAGIIAREMGCEIYPVYDVGVAGLHRLFKPLRQLAKVDIDIIIVAAGMDGALPSVVAGLVNVPVIGLPTSVGYGLGGKGVAALMTMLQTCAPGLTVVNIDNGVGAGATAALTANRMAKLRNQSSP
jgi:pyridinium-3,5-biscarboxylic acid mononucleotide synthase